MDIAEPLLSFDRERNAADVRAILEQAGHLVAGVRDAGRMAGFVEAGKLGEGDLGEAMQPFDPARLLFREAPLDEVVRALEQHAQVFVSVLGQVGLVVTRHDFEKPSARMWLFGMLTIMEMNITTAVHVLFAGDQWQEVLSPGRVEKALALQQERARRGQVVDGIDCLQLPDKLRIMMQDPALRQNLGLESVRASERFIKRVESLRNHLAHSQDIVDSDWDFVVTLCSFLDELTEARKLREILASVEG